MVHEGARRCGGDACLYADTMSAPTQPGWDPDPGSRESKTVDGFDVSVLPAGPEGVGGSNLTATKAGVTFSHDATDFVGTTFEGIPGGLLQITATRIPVTCRGRVAPSE